MGTCKLKAAHHVGHTCLTMTTEDTCVADASCQWDPEKTVHVADDHHCFIKACHKESTMDACNTHDECEFKEHDGKAADCHSQTDVCVQHKTQGACHSNPLPSTTVMHTSNHTNNSSADGANQMAMVGAMTAMVLVGASTVL